jgi:hypothetical protein
MASILAASLVLWWLEFPDTSLCVDLNTFFVLSNATIIGIVLGSLVPSWYRRAMSGQFASDPSNIADRP